MVHSRTPSNPLSSLPLGHYITWYRAEKFSLSFRSQGNIWHFALHVLRDSEAKVYSPVDPCQGNH